MKGSISHYNIPLRELLECINNDPAGIAFITDAENKLCGVVTDGDFRRFLLSGLTLDNFLTRDKLGDFVYGKEGEKIEKLIEKSDNKVRIIPIVDEHMRIVDYFRFENRIHVPVAQPNLEGNEFNYVNEALLSTWISSKGHYVDKFEEGFSNYCGTEYGITTSNGTVAIHLALKALGIGEGDEVIIPDLTFAATVNAVLHSNATPVIVDVEVKSWCIDPDEIERAISPRTKAIIPVHLYGQPCDMGRIMEIARRNNLYVIEDAAEAHGAEFDGQKVGSFGDISCFSFFANKILTTGEGGMCLTNSESLNERMRLLRDHGMSKTRRYWHEEVGFNYRMTNIQAAIGCAQLERITGFIVERAKLESRYKECFKDTDMFRWQQDFDDRKRVVWLVSTLTDSIVTKEKLMDKFQSYNIDVRPFFYPLSTMPIYKGYVFSAKNSHEISELGISLPTVSNLIDFDLLRSVVTST